MSRNVYNMLSVLLRNVSFEEKDIIVICQEDAIKSCFIRGSKLDKPYILKNLVVIVQCLREEFKKNDIVLIDDSLEKNLLNDPYSNVHPQTWSRMNNDNFLKVVLWSWLECLFQLELDVPMFVSSNPLLGGPTPMDRNGTEPTTIFEGCSFASIGGSLDT